MQFPPPPFIPHEPLIPLYEDEHLLAFDKPSGLLCVPGRGPDKQDCLITRVQQQWPETLLIHRLDMSTSGIVLFARSLEMQRAMSAAFAERQVHKTYEALVAGVPAEPGGDWQEISAPILQDWPRRPIHIVDPAGKQSVTRWKVLEQVDGISHIRHISRLALEPITGRTHQLRVHLQHLGFPILGDPLYAPEPVQQIADRLMLHARLLRLSHPVSGQEVCIASNVPF
ncbi:RluA family pseudouridine synthase [Diaphorobacter sp. HDW4B]|uniref:RluA family pseudouridine synthase n=1 Tax=Diaphorobacter sp. HDW4B TaxID=2714925 RepID=UPI001408281D|nr:RluA family pseudouridine synthase [Diaphorobacter sp. HDW4B]QIL73176.1 RluA family pseudouridine synthase [Diaphorobacter sp. HDW4B]